MSTSKKHPNTIRQGGPGASHENAKAPLEARSPRLTIIVVNAARCLAEVARGIVIIRIILARRAANTASNDRRTLRTSGFLL